MSVPVWARSMILNYRRFFKERYGQDSTLSDAVIWEICETIHDDSSKALEDEARVEVMREKEQAS